ncbi:cysteine-rich CWC family protein [Chitinophaga sp.]|uniref:cysteine-rich CWC family protein n=1 Tax=Chitinophaga sp. TaxID=1869181 RepID=UPI00262BC411|nr:cysteine-rich CWC family protein [uncultured Chitinophaga sp.]
MCKHEEKSCPRCGGGFECKVGSIALCQCMTVTLSQEERDYIGTKYADCLCAACLKEMKSAFHQEQHREKLYNISTLLFPKK